MSGDARNGSETVLITGGAGFIGQHLARALVAQGCKVRILDALVSQVHANGSSGDGMHFTGELLAGDVADGASVRAALKGVTAVIHLAAEVGVGQSMYEISRYVRANDLGTARLLEAMIGGSVRKLIVASSMSVYGEGRYVDARGRPQDAIVRNWSGGQQFDPTDAEGLPLRPAPTPETKPVNCRSVYALSKYAQERLCLIFGAHYGVDTVALRLFNVYGPGQALSNPYTGVLANFASRMLNGEPPMIFEDGLQLRDFVHVSDVVAAFVLALRRDGISGEVINVGSGVPVTVLEVAEKLAVALDSPLRPTVTFQTRAGDVRHCYPTIEKARRLLGYTPRQNFADGLEDLANWLAPQKPQDGVLAARRELEQRGLVL